MRLAGTDRSVRFARLALLVALVVPLATHPDAQALTQTTPARAGSLPARLSDSDFWKLQAEISEPDAFFRITDNYTSNEGEIGRIFTMLREAGVSGGVYMGVGPEQNLTYIAATRPVMAFILDIRRQAMVQHLMFKAVFEFSKDRADFISLLFSKPRPANLGASTNIGTIWDAYEPVASSPKLKASTWDRIVAHLTKTRGFTLTAPEMGQLQTVFDAFWYHGPSITTRGSMNNGPGGNNLTFVDLTGYAMDAQDRVQSFLSTDENFQFVKSLHERNLIVPVTGDFGGPKAMRAIAKYVTGHGATVSAFYVSNVEQYLFQDGKDRLFYDNVATLPITPSSVFIRPYSLRRGWGITQSLCAIGPFLASVRAGRIYGNNEALMCLR